MSSKDIITYAQTASLIVVNVIGISLIGVMFCFIRKAPQKRKEKTLLSIILGCMVLGLLLVAFLDVGIYLWIKTGNPLGILSLIPFFVCLSPIFFVIVTIGAYIQLTYWEKIRDFVISYSKNNYEQ
jgi:hypothetical protein